MSFPIEHPISYAFDVAARVGFAVAVGLLLVAALVAAVMLRAEPAPASEPDP